MFDFNLIGTQIRNLRKSVDKLDKEIENLNQERDELVTSPLGFEDVHRLTCEAVDQYASEFPRYLCEHISYVKNKPMATENALLRPSSPAIFVAPVLHRDSMPGMLNIQRALCALFSDRIKEVLGEALRSMDFDEKAIPLARRNRRISEIDVELEKLEAKREELISVAQREGIRI